VRGQPRCGCTDGEILAILGPNGAGKSTFVKAVAGLVPVLARADRSCSHGLLTSPSVPAHRMVFEGLAFAPQTDNVFANLSIAENLQPAASISASRGEPPRARSRRRCSPTCSASADLLASRLSGGQRQTLAVGPRADRRAARADARRALGRA
jgi:branched-chain amino acid transport system ATP-binding protein